MTATVEERLGRIEEKLDQLTTLIKDVEDLKEFKWKVWGAVGTIVPIYTAVVTYVVQTVIVR